MTRQEPVHVNGRYVNPAFAKVAVPPDRPDEEHGFRDFVKWQIDRRKRSRETPLVESVPAREGPFPSAPLAGIRATWIGHSSILLQLDGKSILLDPVWSARVGSVVKRLTPPGLRWEDLPAIDALVLSHDHYDHLDARTVLRLPLDTPVFVPAGVGAWFRKRDFTRVTERSWWEEASFGDHRFTCVPAQHFSGRTPWGRDRTLWGGWILDGAQGSRVYFAGDSGYFGGFREIGDAFPDIDLGLIPVGAYEPRWFMSPVHVDPAEAGQAFLDCGARHMLPIHWGTFRLADEPIDEPPEVLRAWWAHKGLAPERLLVPRLGESFEVKPQRAEAPRALSATAEIRQFEA